MTVRSGPGEQTPRAGIATEVIEMWKQLTGPEGNDLGRSHRADRRRHRASRSLLRDDDTPGNGRRHADPHAVTSGLGACHQHRA